MTDLLNDIYIDDYVQKEKNQRGLLLAQTRFNAQIKPFVDAKPGRLSYVESEIVRIVAEASAEVGADEEYVESRFRHYLAEAYDHPAVAVSEPERIDVDGDREESLPPAKNDPDQKNPEPDAETSVLDTDPVLVDEILEPDAKIDLNENTVKSHCFRCDKEMNPVVAAASKVCVECTEELKKKADLNLLAPAAPSGGSGMSPAQPNTLVQCDFCAAKGYHFEGTQQQVQEHINSQHAQELQQQQQQVQQTGQPPVAAKTAAPADDVSEDDDVAQADEGLESQSNPVHHFDDVVQDMADRAASIKFSTADPEEIQQIADQYGLDPEAVKEKLFTTATFGNYTAVNGSLVQDSDSQVPDGYGEVDLEGMGGRVDSHEAAVPVQLAVEKVAQDLQMKDDLVYNMLKDSYGDDLSEQYYASVQGEHRYFLPSDMLDVKDSGPSDTPTQPSQSVGPTPQPAQNTSPVAAKVTLKDLLEIDRRRVEARRRRLR